MQGNPDIDVLMIPTSKAIKKHVKDRDAFTEIYNRAYEAVMISMEAKEAENATLREQLRWRNTIDEQPSYYQEVLVRPRIAKQCISTFIYFDQFAEMFKRDYVEWLPIPEVE